MFQRARTSARQDQSSTLPPEDGFRAGRDVTVAAVRVQPDTIPAPPFPRRIPWINVAPLRMDKQLGRPVLVEFWDFCRVNSLRTLPYLKAWHERYAADGLRVIGIHTGGFLPARETQNAVEATHRPGVEYPV